MTCVRSMSSRNDILYWTNEPFSLFSELDGIIWTDSRNVRTLYVALYSIIYFLSFGDMSKGMCGCVECHLLGGWPC